MPDRKNGDSKHQITEMLVAWGSGDQTALTRLMPLVYNELHKLARRYMSRENPGHVLQTSALVNEAYLRLFDQRRTRLQNRAQFFGLAAQMMRRILVDHARRRKAEKHGGGALHLSLDVAAAVSDERTADVIDLDDALSALASLDRRQGRIVELRVFGGMTIRETAQAVGISADMVKREWSTAKAWLYREISRST